MKNASKKTTKKEVTNEDLSDFVTREEFDELERRVTKLEQKVRK
jgi:polyhydroxyalkanoate synthesis regulator phasin